MRVIVFAILLIAPSVSAAEVPGVLWTPAGAYLAAWRDAKDLESQHIDVSHYRWLHSTSATTKAELQNLYEQAAFVTNKLNFVGHSLSQPKLLDDGRLLRIDIGALYISSEAWDNLGRNGAGISPFPEPYFHTIIDTKPARKLRAIPGTWNSSTREWQWEEFLEEGKRVLAVAEHVSKSYAIELIALTGSEFPVYRTDWFCAYALQVGAYEAFQGNPKDFDDFLKLAGAERRQFDRTAVALRGASLFSEVTHNNRIIERIPTDRRYGKGYFYHTFDYFTSVRGNDIFANLLNRKRDAGELIWSLPNGLHGYGLVAFDEKKGIEKFIGFADPVKAATDSRTKRQNKTVISGMSCVHCHSKGAIPVNDEVRATAQDTVAITDTKYRDRIGDVYFGADLNTLFFEDQKNYASVVKALTGKDPAAISLAFEDLVYRYQDAPLGIDEISIEMGYPKETILPVIQEASRTGQLSRTFVGALKNRQARRDQFEENYHQLQRLLIRVKTK